jgi:hypothetical protein
VLALFIERKKECCTEALAVFVVEAEETKPADLTTRRVAPLRSSDAVELIIMIVRCFMK